MNEFVMNLAGIGLAALGIVLVLTAVGSVIRGLFSHYDRWHYAIKWNALPESGGVVYGRSDITTKSNIDRKEAVHLLQDTIAEDQGFDSVLITGWTLYRRENIALRTAWDEIKGKMDGEKKEGGE